MPFHSYALFAFSTVTKGKCCIERNIGLCKHTDRSHGDSLRFTAILQANNVARGTANNVLQWPKGEHNVSIMDGC